MKDPEQVLAIARSYLDKMPNITVADFRNVPPAFVAGYELAVKDIKPAIELLEMIVRDHYAGYDIISAGVIKQAEKAIKKATS